MTTLTIKVNEKTAAGKRFISFIKTLPFISIENEGTENIPPETKKGIEESMKDIEDGRVFSAKNTKDMFNQIFG